MQLYTVRFTSVNCCTCFRSAPDDGWRYHLKHVQQFTDINKTVYSCILVDNYWHISMMHGPLNIKSTPMYPVTINTTLLLLRTILLTVTESICLQIQCFTKPNCVPAPLLRLLPREYRRGGMKITRKIRETMLQITASFIGIRTLNTPLRIAHCLDTSEEVAWIILSLYFS
jgi:hypothetical protein